MDKYAKAAEKLKDLGKPKGDSFFYAVVTKINGDTCSVTIGDFELSGVRLKATDDGASDKFVIFPKLKSKVVVAANHGDLRDLFICKVDDPERILYKHKDVSIEIDAENGKIKINGGDLGGLIKIEELVKRLNAIEDQHNNLLKDYKLHVHPVPVPTGGMSSTITPPPMINDIDNSNRDQLEDKNVLH
ncbi:MAG: hypothetical protein WCL00_00120 [Bacteroidota bacterium]